MTLLSFRAEYSRQCIWCKAKQFQFALVNVIFCMSEEIKVWGIKFNIKTDSNSKRSRQEESAVLLPHLQTYAVPPLH